jgi:glycosyltransferase involved in cell wall biosynthesis
MYLPVLGGAELHLMELSKGLASRGHDVTVLTLNVRRNADLQLGVHGDLPGLEIMNGVRVVRLPVRGGYLELCWRALERVRGGYRLSRMWLGDDGVAFVSRPPPSLQFIPPILRSNADVVATMNWSSTPAYGAYLARRLKRFTLVGIPLFHTARAWSQRDSYVRMLSTCDAVIVNTAHEGRFVQSSVPCRILVGGVGVHPQAFADANGEDVRARHGLGKAPVVGFIGRQDPNKGLLLVIQAMQHVWRWNNDVRLMVAGVRIPDMRVERAFNSLDDWERQRVIRIDDFPEADKPGLYAALDILVLPSTEESFGISYLEAWMCGKPVIGARIGSTECVIDEGVDGLLVDPDDTESLARGIVDLLTSPRKREAMGHAGRAKTVAQFTWDRVTERVESLYKELSSEARKRP